MPEKVNAVTSKPAHFSPLLRKTSQNMSGHVCAALLVMIEP